MCARMCFGQTSNGLHIEFPNQKELSVKHLFITFWTNYSGREEEQGNTTTSTRFSTGTFSLCYIHHLTGPDHPITWLLIPMLCWRYPALSVFPTWRPHGTNHTPQHLHPNWIPMSSSIKVDRNLVSSYLPCTSLPPLLHFIFLYFRLCLHSISTLSPLAESD